MDQEITYGKKSIEGNLTWQPVFINGEYVAELGQRDFGLFNPPIMFYQVLAEDTELNKNLCNYWYHSEDDGFIYLRFSFENDSKFLEYIKSQDKTLEKQ